LVENNLSISNFNKLGPQGELHLATTEEGARARNTMHNRLKADAFIPAGEFFTFLEEFLDCNL